MTTPVLMSVPPERFVSSGLTRFNDYGLESKAILDELLRRNWLILDPLPHFHKVVEIKTESSEKWKVVRPPTPSV
jgi:hypothetical protein